MCSDLGEWVLPLLAALVPIVLWYRWPAKREVVTGTVFTVGLVLGAVGFWLDPVQPPRGYTVGAHVFDSLYFSLQLTLLGVDVENTRGCLLGIARVLLPLAAARVLLILLVRRLGNWRLRAWLSIKPPSTLVLGCGRNGRGLARFYHDVHEQEHANRGRLARFWRRRVVVVDSDEERLHLASFEGKSVYRLHGGSDAWESLLAANALNARRVVVCTGDDQYDYKVVRWLCAELRKTRRAGPRKKSAPQIIMSVDTDAVARAVPFDRDLSDNDVRLLNLPRLQARRLLRAYAPHLLNTEKFKAGRTNACHIVVVGHGPMLDEVATYAVSALVYDPTVPLRVTVLTADAEAAERRVLARHPVLALGLQKLNIELYGGHWPIAEFAFIETADVPIAHNALVTANAELEIDAIYIVGESDELVIAMTADALKVADLLPSKAVAVVACLNHKDRIKSPTDMLKRLSESDTKKAGDLRANFKVFDLQAWQEPRTGQCHPEEFDDIHARTIWTSYETRWSSNATRTFDDAAWRSLPPQEQRWNRYAGDHASIKLRLADVEHGRSSERAAFGALVRHVDWLAKLEHTRYVRERLMEGWLPRPLDETAPGKFNAYHLNPTIEPFAGLDPGEKDKDYDNVVGPWLEFWRFDVPTNGTPDPDS